MEKETKRRRRREGEARVGGRRSSRKKTGDGEGGLV